MRDRGVSLEVFFYNVAGGVFAGLLAGLFGVGGGLVIVPILYHLLPAQGVAAPLLMKVAIGTSLATIVVTSLSSAWSHYRKNAVDLAVLGALSLGLLPGAILAAVSARVLRNDFLVFFFVGFELLVAIQMGLALKVKPHRRLPRKRYQAGAGLVIGYLSGLVGIGGGTLSVPYLSWHNVPIKVAVGTSAACGFPIALAGMTGFLLVGLSDPASPPAASGYILWPAFLAIVLGSVFAAPLGAKLAHRLSSPVLKRLFAVFLALVAGKMLWSVV